MAGLASSLKNVEIPSPNRKTGFRDAMAASARAIRGTTRTKPAVRTGRMQTSVLTMAITNVSSAANSIPGKAVLVTTLLFLTADLL